MKHLDLYARVRHAVMVRGISRRDAAGLFGINRRTIEKMLQFSVPPGYRRAHIVFAALYPTIRLGILSELKRPKSNRKNSSNMLSHVTDLTEVIARMVAVGHAVTPELVSSISPYTRGHIRYFGTLVLYMDEVRHPRPFERILNLSRII